jgi:hypothetical protein
VRAAGHGREMKTAAKVFAQAAVVPVATAALTYASGVALGPARTRPPSDTMTGAVSAGFPSPNPIGLVTIIPEASVTW